MAERKFFGTDGIRGTANIYPMTADVALKLAQATSIVLNRGDHRHKVVIGKDTRLSGYMLEPAMVAGFISMGYDVFLVGPMPTPAVAMLTKSLRADLGVMISASHNPYQDNGIKLFAADGYKLSDEIEAKIETLIEQDLTEHLAPSEHLGRAKRIDDAQGRYIEYVKNTLARETRLDHLKVVVDCAHGAAYQVAPTVLYELGAEVISIGVSPDGKNINKNCGATSTQILSETVVQNQADIGIALDGDADRLIICDEHGNVIDGDQIMALIATRLHQKNLLSGGAVAATVMSNLGLEHYLKGLGIELIRTKVGDRYVVEAMKDQDLALGGEQSGHIILRPQGTTGDGLVAALSVLSMLKQSEKPASETCQMFTPVPQTLKNVRVTDKAVAEDKAVLSAIETAKGTLGTDGRILVRPSGTEPIIRVMGEGLDSSLVEKCVDDICTAIKNASPVKALEDAAA